jgi:nitrogen fixation protein NifU and related proteins
MSDLFGEIILDEAKNPANFGELANADLKKTSYNASCGDVINASIKLSPDKTKIENIKWTGEGCTISMATMSLLSQKLIGMELSKVKKLDAEDMSELLEIENISPGRLKCLTIGLSGVKEMIE